MRVLLRTIALLLGLNLSSAVGWLLVTSRNVPQSHSLVFISSRTGFLQLQVYRMRIDGRLVEQLTTQESDGRSRRFPTWSPDGEWIAFASFGGGLTQINKIHLTNRIIQPVLPETIEFNASMSNPVWSPDGNRIAFVSNNEIYLLEQENIRQLTNNFGIAIEPTWSPDSQWIAFTTDLHGPTEIYKIHLVTGQEMRLTNSRGINHYPTWSPDSQWIAFASNRDGFMQIYRMRSDGSQVEQLTYENANSTLPAWSPDGYWIAFVSERTGKPEIYRMRPDGKDMRQLTQSRGDNIYPAWGPAEKTTWIGWPSFIIAFFLFGIALRV